MVLWEMTAITAYFLGLKRTYRLALRLQRRFVGPNHPRIRQFLHRRTHNVFDVAVKVHKRIQHRDIEVGRNMGNWILRWLHRMKPSAEISVPAPKASTSSRDTPKHVASSSQPLGTKENNIKAARHEANGRALFTATNMKPKYFPTMSMMLQLTNSANGNCQCRHISYAAAYGSSFKRRGGFVDSAVLRDDVARWMLH